MGYGTKSNIPEPRLYCVMLYHVKGVLPTFFDNLSLKQELFDVIFFLTDSMICMFSVIYVINFKLLKIPDNLVFCCQPIRSVLITNQPIDTVNKVEVRIRDHVFSPVKTTFIVK